MDYHYRSYNFTRTTKDIHEFSIVKEKKKKFRSSLFFFFETQRHFLIYKKLTNKTPIVLTRFLEIINCYSITLTSLISLNGKIRQKGIHEFSIVKGKKEKIFQSSLFFF